MTDFVISNDLVVLGMSTFTGGQTFDGQAIVDLDNTEALLVRKDGDSGDVLVVDTVNDIVRIGSGLATPGDGLDMEALVLTGDGSRDSHAILFTAQSFGESSLTERDWKMFADISQSRLSVDFQQNEGGYANIFGMGTLGQVFLGSGVAGGSSRVVLRLDQLALTGDGSNNSNILELRGASFETATPHTIDWRQQVSLLDNLGDSQYIWSSGIDLAFTTRMTLNDSGDLTLPGGVFTGPAPPTSGGFGLSNQRWVVWRNFGDNADIEILRADGGNNTVLNTLAGESLILSIGNVTQVEITTGGLLTMPIANSAISLGTNASATGDIRFGNTRFIAWRNMNNNGDVQALSVDEDDFLNIGSAAALRSRILSPSFVALNIGPHIFGGATPVDHWQILFTGSFTSGGSSNESAKFRIEGSLTGADGDTAGMVGAYFDATFVTQTAVENIANISQCRFDGANITDNLTGDITNAQTLFITASPTAGEANWTIRSTALAPSIFQGLQFAIGRTSLEDWHQFVVSGAFISGGSSTEADKFKVESSLTGAPGDTGALNGAFFGASIVTQTATESIGDIAQVKIVEPFITDNLTGSITNAQTLLLTGSPTEGVNNFALRSTGPARTMFIGLPFSIGTNVVQDVFQVQIRGNFTSGGASNVAAKFEIEESVIGVSGDTVYLGGAVFQARVTTQTAAEVVTDVFQVRIVEPVITLGAGSSITNAQSLLIVSAPTEGVNNYALRVVTGDVILGGNLAVSGAGPHAIAGTPSGIIGLIISETFTSDGSGTLASGIFVTQTLVGASGDTTSLTGTTFISAITTQTETESIANISQVEINEPFITDNLTGDITNAQTLLIVSSPTEGEANYSLRSAGTAPTLFAGLQFVVGLTVVTDRIQFLLAGNFTSGGGSTDAQVLTLNGQLTGASGDTGFLAGAYFTSSIVTQTETESITDITQVRIDEPTITDNLTGDITIAQTLLLTGSPTEGLSNFTLRSTGLAPTMFQGLQFVIGPGPTPAADFRQVLITGAFTSGGGATEATKFRVEGRLTGASGDITRLTGAEFGAGVTTQAVAEVVASVSQVHIEEPSIILGAGSSITNAQTLLVVSAPTEGVNNYALRVAAGATLLGGEFEHTGSTFGIFSTTPTTQPAAYTRNAVVVEDRTLLASASATTLNNNNVLAALIADLQSLGIIG